MTTDDMADLQQVTLPPGLVPEDFGPKGALMDASPGFVLVYAPNKRLGALFNREARQWLTWHPVELQGFAEGMQRLLAMDKAAADEAQSVLDRMRKH